MVNLRDAGEDAAAFARLAAGFVLESSRRGEDELPLAHALRIGVAVESLFEYGVGLEQLLDATLAELAAQAARRPGAVSRDLERAVVLSLTRHYLEAESRENRARFAELRALVRISRAVHRTLDPGLVAEAGLAETLRAMDLEAGAVWLGGGESLSLVRTAGIPDDVRRHLLRLDVAAHPAVRWALAGRVAIGAEAPPGDPVFGGYRSALMAPLRGTGDGIGLIAVGSRLERRFDPADVDFATAAAEVLSGALEHAFEHRREAHTDYLTGLSNRSDFETAVRRELAGLRRRPRLLSLVLLDLDDLKQVNDGAGHHAGDEALQAVARVIRRMVRTSDVSARLGGDEFAIAMLEAGADQAREVARRIGQALRAEHLEAAPDVVLELSAGVVEWQPGQEYEDLFATADRLLYREKGRHRARRARLAARAARLAASKPSSPPSSSPPAP